MMPEAIQLRQSNVRPVAPGFLPLQAGQALRFRSFLPIRPRIGAAAGADHSRVEGRHPHSTTWGAGCRRRHPGTPTAGGGLATRPRRRGRQLRRPLWSALIVFVQDIITVSTRSRLEESLSVSVWNCRAAVWTTVVLGVCQIRPSLFAHFNFMLFHSHRGLRF
jgi:hypothetical protein